MVHVTKLGAIFEGMVGNGARDLALIRTAICERNEELCTAGEGIEVVITVSLHLVQILDALLFTSRSRIIKERGVGIKGSGWERVRESSTE